MVTPAAATLVSLRETAQLTASAQDASGNGISGKTFSWSSSSEAVATVNATGLVTAVANGSVTITATTDGVNGTATVLVDQVAAQLAFTAEPATAVVGAAISPAVEVAIQDAGGSTVSDATDALTLTIGTNPSGGTLSGATTVNAAAGVGSFTDLSIDQAGTGYTLVATSGSLGSATSAPFAIVDVFVVNTSDDLDSGTCDAIHCSLREALKAANGSPGLEAIAFNIPGPGPHTIQPSCSLPIVTDPVIIDGYTQPGANPNTNGPGLGSNAVLMIELDGSNGGAGCNGLEITAGSSTVRGLAINRMHFGISLRDGGGNVIEGNFLGTDITGTAPRANEQHGVSIVGTVNNTIGGTMPAARNIISGNAFFGVGICGCGVDSTTGNVVQGNFIGTDVTGTTPLSNRTGVNIHLAGNSNTIGGTIVGARNIISGNSLEGVALDPDVTGNVVEGNFIGTDVTGTVALGNGNTGVSIQGLSGASGNTIGGTTSGAGNTIAYNGFSGVFVDGSGTANAILSNSIFSNGGLMGGRLGIDLAPSGVTANDTGDGDTGSNNLQNFPVLTTATSGNGSVTIGGDLNSTPNADFRLEFFTNTACDPSGYGEGETFLGSTMVTTDGSGDASFSVTFSEPVTVGQFITATATDTDNNTSEFSPCTTVD